ncbi:carboxypeptidase-like regulatory domain-containing protein [Fluviicola chungangensis]|nr:carboxypeptidase-like regulatory domain-containing protein [Fluviicola chungangensis]
MTVKGRVLNPITGEGISNVPVIIHRSTLDYPSGSKRVKETTTDSDGYFEISKASLSKCYLTCHVTEIGDYYPIGWEKKDNVPLFDAFTISVKKGKTMHADYYALPYGQLHWHIKNINCEGSTDTMWYKIKHQYDNDFLSIWSSPFAGCVDIVGNGSDKMKMGTHIIYMKISRPSGTIYKYDTVFVNENGITNFDLLY